MTAPAFIVTVCCAYAALLAILWASDERSRRIHAERRLAALEHARRTMVVSTRVPGGDVMTRYTSMDSGIVVRR